MRNDDRGDPSLDVSENTPPSRGREFLVTALLAIFLGSYWRMEVTGSGIFAVTMLAALVAILWIEVVPAVRKEWKRRR
jgi:hypothetical protein